MMKKSLLKSIILSANIIAMLLGILVLYGWYTQNITLIQIFPGLVPMQYNTALGFLLCGLGILIQLFEKKRLAQIFCGLAGLMGFLTLLQYIFGISFGIDQLFMKHYVTVETSHPGRMAPNTALCFTLTGISVFILNRFDEFKNINLIVGVISSILVALGTVAFTGYLSGVTTAYGWGNLTRMAVHTSVGFILIGISLFMLVWYKETTDESSIFPNWIVYPIGIGAVTVSVALWQAIIAELRSNNLTLPYVVLLSGLIMTILLILLIRFAQIASSRAKELLLLNEQLEDDITERKQAEEKLRQKDYIIESASSAIAMSDLDGKITYANPAFLEMWGFQNPEEFKGKRFTNFWMVKDRYNEIMTTLQEEGKWNQETQARRKDASIFDVQVFAALVKDGEGNPIGLMSSSVDITDHRQAEKKIRKLSEVVKQSPMYVIITDHLGKIEYVNPALLEVTGYTQEEMLGKNPRILKSGKTPQSVYESLWETILLGKTWKGELLNKRKDGTLYLENATISPIVDQNGNIKNFIAIKEDITERKQMEKELQTTQMYFTDFLNVSSDVVVYWRVPTGLKTELPIKEQIEMLYNSVCIDANKAAADFYGFKKKNDLVEKEYIELVKEKSIDQAYSNFINNNYQLIDYEVYEVLIDGSIEYALENWHGVVEDGLLLNIWTSSKIITEQKKAQLALKVSEEKFSKVFFSSPDSITVTSIQEGSIMDCNEEFEKLFGYQRDEAIGKTTIELGLWLHTEDRERIKGILQRDKRLTDYEINMYNKSKEIRSILLSSEVVEINGKPHSISIGRDITERKRIEKELHTTQMHYTDFITASSDLVSYWKMPSDLKIDLPIEEQIELLYQSVCVDANKVFWENYGFNNKNEMIGKKYIELIQEKTFNKTYSEFINNDYQLKDYESYEKSKDGRKLYSLESWYGVVENEKLTYLWANSKDITERKKVEEELRQYRLNLENLVNQRTQELKDANIKLGEEVAKQKEAERTVKMALEKEKELGDLKSRFISTASHEFRTPLTTILSSSGLLEIFRKKGNLDKYQEHRDQIQSSVRFLTGLIEDVLTLDKTESGKIGFAPEMIDLYLLASNVFKEISGIAGEKHHCNFNYTLSKGNEIYLDKKLVKLILTNLVSNAIKYSPDGGKIELEIFKHLDQIIMRVSDEGIGIAKEDKELIFEQFHRGINLQDIQGSGLGLSIVKKSVELHGGTIEFESETSKGSIFIVSLPLFEILK